MPDPQDDLAPGKKDPVEGARDGDQGADPKPTGGDGGHLGAGGDPAEGKDAADG